MHVSPRGGVLSALSVLLSLASVTPPALADPNGDLSNGVICQFASVSDPNAEPGTQSGQLSGGPVNLFDEAGAPETGALSCTVQVNQPTHAGTGPSIAGSGTGVFVMSPEIIDYQADADDDVYLCATFVDASENVSYYWDDETLQWSADINTPCGTMSGEPDSQAVPRSGSDPDARAGASTTAGSVQDRRPHGTVDIWGNTVVPGSVTWAFSGPLSCSLEGLTVTCLPARAASTCAHLDAAGDSNTGAASACASPPGAHDPGAPSMATHSKFPWTCTAEPIIAIAPFHAHCEVNRPGASPFG